MKRLRLNRAETALMVSNSSRPATPCSVSDVRCFQRAFRRPPQSHVEAADGVRAFIPRPPFRVIRPVLILLRFKRLEGSGIDQGLNRALEDAMKA
jgi:hypothetical protein